MAAKGNYEVCQESGIRAARQEIINAKANKLKSPKSGMAEMALPRANR